MNLLSFKSLLVTIFRFLCHTKGHSGSISSPVLGRLYVVIRMEPGLAVCKDNTLKVCAISLAIFYNLKESREEAGAGRLIDLSGHTARQRQSQNHHLIYVVAELHSGIYNTGSIHKRIQVWDLGDSE